MTDDDLDDLVAHWLALREEGRTPDPAQFASRHPEHRVALQKAIEALIDTENLLPQARLPDRVGRWRILRLLGTGGSGAVFEAVDVSDPERRSALKLLSPAHANDERARSRLRREARMLMQDPHPNVVRVLEVGPDDAIPWLAMDLVEGSSLREVLDRARTRQPAAGDPPCALLDFSGEGDPYARVARCGRDLARALEWAHSRGLVHRDLKPANVMIRPDGTPALLDFGLAADATATALTQSGDVLGTPAYMAPEQARGERATPAADVYGLGAILYELIALRPPFEGPDASAVLRLVRTSLATRLGDLDPAVPAALARVIEAAMAPRARWRPSSAGALADDLERFIEGRPVEARPPSGLARMAWRVAARPVLVLAAAAALLLVVSVAAILAQGAAERRRERALADALERAALILVEPIGTQGLEGAAREIAALAGSPALGGFLADLAADRPPAPAEDPAIGRLVDAERARKAGDHARARALLEQTVAGAPDSPIAWAMLARLARSDPERSRLRASIAAACDHAPDRPALQAGLGHVLLAEGDFQGAAHAFGRARTQAREPAYLAFHEACALDKSGRADDALSAARDGGPSILVRFGRFLDRERRREQAWAVFREVLRVEPDRIDARFHLATSLSAAEEVEAAAREFRELLARQPAHAPALISLAWLHAWVCGHERCAAVRDPDRAIELAGSAVRADGGRERAILTTATRIARHLDRKEPLQRVIEEVLRTSTPGTPEAALLEDALRELAAQ